MESIVLYCKRLLHVGYPYMLGRIIKMDFGEEFDIVTVRYEPDILNPVIDDKVFKVFKIKEVNHYNH